MLETLVLRLVAKISIIVLNLNVVRNDTGGTSAYHGLTYASKTSPRVLTLMNSFFYSVLMRLTKEFPVQEKTVKTRTALS